MTDLIVIAILVVVVGLALGYIIRARKRGVKCIGCPEGCRGCQQNEGSACCCHTDAADQKKA